MRAAWISRQLAQFSRYERRKKPRQYLSGESHLYLGRQYRLLVIPQDASVNSTFVKLTRGLLVVSSPKQLPREKVRSMRCAFVFGRVPEVFNNNSLWVYPTFGLLGCPKPLVSVRQMKRRWGSLSKKQRMTLNLKLIQVPRSCIEYVIVHELVPLNTSQPRLPLPQTVAEDHARLGEKEVSIGAMSGVTWFWDQSVF